MDFYNPSLGHQFINGQQVLGLDGCVGPGSAFNLDNPGCGMAR